MNNRAYIWSIIFILLSFSNINAAQDAEKVIATLEKFDGVVKILPKDSIRRAKATEHHALYSGDMVLSYRNAHALIVLSDGSKVVLDESASISFAINEVAQKSGAAYYEIHHRNAKNALDVKTEFAIIGIKGTTFIVNADDKKESIALKEGQIEVKSPEAAFKLYREKVDAAFGAYKNKQNSDFESYKKAQREKIASEVKAFEMYAGKVVRFSGNTADESDFDTNVTAEFERFKRIETSLH